MNINNTRFSAILNNSKEEVRIAAYYGVAEAIINKYFKDLPGNKKIFIRKTVDCIGEVVIIDRVMVNRIFDNTLAYKENVMKHNPDLFGCNSFAEYINLQQYYSKRDIDIIDNNFGAFRQAIIVTNEVSDELLSSLLDD